MTDFIYVSMPYAKFDSKWFAHVPNINLGILDALLTDKGKEVKTFHFHLSFLPFLDSLESHIKGHLLLLSRNFGVEYLSLDYVFASLLFEDHYHESKERFEERLGSVGLTLDDFEALRDAGRSFVEHAFTQLSPHLADAKLFGCSCSHYQLSGSLLLCALIKTAYPQVRTIVGGKDCAGAFSRELMSSVDFLDFVGIGECEVTVAALLEHLEDQNKPLCNTLYREAGRIRESGREPNISMEGLPFPSYHFDEFPLDKGDLILPLELGRGCPWGKCTFCPDESYDVRCQSKTANQVLKEMEYYQGISRDLKNFIILDPDALKDRQLVVELSRYLRGKDFSFHFAEFRAERMDKEVLQSLLHFGTWVSHFQVGIESFSDRILNLMNKGVSALKNAEVLKMVAELGVPLQFNLFTCYPNMTMDDLQETLRVMDRISHLLAHENILIYPGEFYLPTDCPVFLKMENYDLERDVECIFSDIFEGFPMPSYSNYPYPYAFGNQDEQARMAQTIRDTVSEIKDRELHENFMCYEKDQDALRVLHSRGGERQEYNLKGLRRDVYLVALETSQQVKALAQTWARSEQDIQTAVDEFDEKGLVLCSSDGGSFLSLATACKNGQGG